jgi:ABC-type transport system substrate-binding protein
MKSRQLLADAGYPNGFKTNIVADAAGDMDLLKIVQSYFAQVGIEMEIRIMDSATASAFIHAWKIDQLAQLGRTGKLGSLGINPVNFVSRLHSSPSHYMAINDPILDAFHPKAWEASSFDEIKKLLRDCNEYVARKHFIISLLQPMECTLYQPWFKGYDGQPSSISGPSGPHLLFYYPARFWIDQKLKKHMGY